jgi:hypothetical protein
MMGVQLSVQKRACDEKCLTPWNIKNQKKIKREGEKREVPYPTYPTV